MFSNKDLKRMIVPLFLEQLLVILVGLADTFVISFAGESAVSGVSLVNSFSTIFIFLFTLWLRAGLLLSASILAGKSGKWRESLPASFSWLPFFFHWGLWLPSCFLGIR